MSPSLSFLDVDKCSFQEMDILALYTDHQMFSMDENRIILTLQNFINKL